MNLHFIPNSLHESTRAEATVGLNQQLADALDLGLQAKQAHWNVRGPHFQALHLLFDEVAEAFEEITDTLAERVVQLGGIAGGTSQVIVRDSRMPVYDVDLYRESDHVRALAESLARFAASTQDALRTADKLGDPITADIFTQTARTAENLLWKVSSHLSEGQNHQDGDPFRAGSPSTLASPNVA